MPTSPSIARRVLAQSNNLPIRSDLPVHSGKVRSVYWLTKQDSQRLIESNGYDVPIDSELAVMIITDRISAFECIWKGEGGMAGVPGKGASLNAISNHWFDLFRKKGLADSHIVDIPHPLVWIVQKAQPVMIEAIARQYITGSMWRSYSKGERSFCGIMLPEGLNRDSKLSDLLITPSTKGILKNIPGVPEVDDVNITRLDIEKNFSAFRFNSPDDIPHYEILLKEGFDLISQSLQDIGQIFVDTKFEFGYVKNSNGEQKLIYMDEVGTPDSSRIWDAEQYKKGNVIENSKEVFRKALLNYFPDPDILTNKNRMQERAALAKDGFLPETILQEVSDTYIDMAEKIIGKPLPVCEDPESEIIDILNTNYSLIT